MFDASCLYGTSSFSDLSSAAFKAWNHSPITDVFDSGAVISAAHVIEFPFILGQHYFVTNPVTGTGLSPKWDFTSAAFAGNPAAFVVGSKIDDVPAPTNSAVNIDWLYLTSLTGTLANEIYRVDTQGGQPPTSVYASNYESLNFVLTSFLYLVHPWIAGNLCQVYHGVLWVFLPLKGFLSSLIMLPKGFTGGSF